jgi:hypothetical protein
MDVGLVNLGVAEGLLDRVESATEQILAKLFDTSTSERGIEVNTRLKKRVDLNGSLSSRRKGTLGMLASSAKTTKGTRTLLAE